MDLRGFKWIYMDLGGFMWIYFDLGGFIWIYLDLGGFRRIWSQDVCQPVASCGGLWRPVGRESWALKKDCSNPRLQYPKLGDL